MSRVLVLLVVVGLAATLVTGQNYDLRPRLPFPNSPCHLVFRYNQSQPDQDTWMGWILVSVNKPLQGLRLQVNFTERSNVLSSEIGEVWTINNQDYTILDLKRKLELKPKGDFLVRFRVTYGDLDPTPLVRTIELNGNQICPPPTETSTQDEAFLEARMNEKKLNDEFPLYFVFSEPLQNSYDPKDCGKIKIRSPVGYILNSEEAPHGHFPWHAALSQYEQPVRSFKYICGGSLISPSHVLTAGHCVVPPGLSNNLPLSKENLLVTLGKYTSRDIPDDGVQDRRVNAIDVHPSFTFNIHGAKIQHDIAMITLTKPAIINNLVRPICLWERDKPDLSNIINKYGTVPGWGLEVDDKQTETLRQARMPVVRVDTCLYSDPLFYGFYTNNYTYCAGSRSEKDAIVCKGDSGGGMVFKKDDSLPAEDTIWLLRGVVSLGKQVANSDRCDPRHYVIFTDVAKYLDWILQILDEKRA